MDETKKIGVIGARKFWYGAAMTLSGKGHAVTLWARRPEQVADMRKTHQNMHYLPDVTLPEALQFTDDLQDAVQGQGPAAADSSGADLSRRVYAGRCLHGPADPSR